MLGNRYVCRLLVEHVFSPSFERNRSTADWWRVFLSRQRAGTDESWTFLIFFDNSLWAAAELNRGWRLYVVLAAQIGFWGKWFAFENGMNTYRGWPWLWQRQILDLLSLWYMYTDTVRVMWIIDNVRVSTYYLLIPWNERTIIFLILGCSKRIQYNTVRTPKSNNYS